MISSDKGEGWEDTWEFIYQGLLPRSMVTHLLSLNVGLLCPDCRILAVHSTIKSD